MAKGARSRGEEGVVSLMEAWSRTAPSPWQQPPGRGPRGSAPASAPATGLGTLKAPSPWAQAPPKPPPRGPTDPQSPLPMSLGTPHGSRHLQSPLLVGLGTPHGPGDPQSPLPVGLPPPWAFLHLGLPQLTDASPPPTPSTPTILFQPLLFSLAPGRTRTPHPAPQTNFTG